MLRIAICDDDSMDLSNISAILDRYQKQSRPNLQFMTFQTGFALLSAMESGISFDIVLLDVQMPEMNGIQVARQIRQTNTNVEIVFLTSSAEYAVESYDVHAYHYLLKPVIEEKLCSTLERCISELSHNQNYGFVVYDKMGGAVRINFSEFMYGEAMRKSVGIYTANSGFVTAKMSFSELCKKISDIPDFIQPHRSYLVNMSYIQRITKKDISLTNGAVIPLSRNKVAEISEAFLSFASDNVFRKEKSE